MDYEWDAAKAAENRRRHGIDFADSIAAIEDRTGSRRSTIGSSTGKKDTDHRYGGGNVLSRQTLAVKDVPHHRPEGHAI